MALNWCDEHMIRHTLFVIEIIFLKFDPMLV